MIRQTQPASLRLSLGSINRTQGVVLGFLATSIVGLILILTLAPGLIDGKLQSTGGDPVAARVVFIGALAVLISLLAIGVLRRWRWTFWLVTLAFLFGVLRIPASGLELAGAIRTGDPSWYVLLQGFIGAVQLTVGLLMIRGCRRAGPWGRF